MKVLRCEIKNYRSIKKMEIDTQDRLKVFIGHNEAGKSNIIKALSLLDPQTPISKDDIRDNLSDEGIISESYVCFTFKFEDFELIELETEIQKKILPHHRNQRFIKHSDGSIYSLKEFLVKNNEIFYMINLKEQTKYENFVSPTKYGLVETVKGIKPGSSFSYEYEKKSYNINQFQYLIQNEEMQIPENYLIDTKFEKFYTLVNVEKKKIYIKNYPKVFVLNFYETPQLPQCIKINDFINNPAKCMPLKNMFSLYGINNISKVIMDSRNKKNGLTNLLRNISKKVTQFMREIWEEQQEIGIIINESGDNIEIAIEDKENLYEFSRRSDGFKRFVYFILQIAAQSSIKEIKNTYLLIDEPDIGLHPSGSQKLFLELLNISKTNYVYYSTHSIFMINKNDMNCHYIVKKENEKTSLTQVKTTDIVDHEILYNALGYSIFENLKKKNIIFEGWRDKRIFEIYLEKYSSLDKELGYCFSQGVKDIQRVVSILELANRDYLIVSDSDKPAVEAKEKFHTQNKWLKYNDFNKEIVTSEDYITIDYNIECFKQACNYFSIKVYEEDLPQSTNNIVENFTKVFDKQKIDKNVRKNILNKYKSLIIDGLSIENINQKYTIFVDSLLKKI